MVSESFTARDLLRWGHSRELKNDGGVLRAGHRLNQLPAFGDALLAELIDRHPRSEIKVSSSGHQPLHPSDHRIGVLGRQDGRTLLRMLRDGRFRLTLRNVAMHHDGLSRLLHRLDSEFTARSHRPASRAYDGNLVLESPAMIQYLSVHAMPTTTWQIRGSSTLRRYAVTPAMMTTKRLATELVGGRNQTGGLYLEPAMETLATASTLDDGQVEWIDQYVPHRITGGNSFNVRLNIHHLDQLSCRRHQTIIGNHWMNQFVPCNVAIDSNGKVNHRGPLAWMKRCIAIARTGSATVQRLADSTLAVDASFELDGDCPNGMRLFDSPVFDSPPLDSSKPPTSSFQSVSKAIVPPTALPPVVSSMALTQRS